MADIAEYISLTSHSNAIAYLERYDKKLILLQHNPKMGTACINKNILHKCRVLRFESHIVIYEENQEKSEIFIIRIFHHSVNYQKQI